MFDTTDTVPQADEDVPVVLPRALTPMMLYVLRSHLFGQGCPAGEAEWEAARPVPGDTEEALLARIQAARDAALQTAFSAAVATAPEAHTLAPPLIRNEPLKFIAEEQAAKDEPFVLEFRVSMSVALGGGLAPPSLGTVCGEMVEAQQELLKEYLEGVVSCLGHAAAEKSRAMNGPKMGVLPMAYMAQIGTSARLPTGAEAEAVREAVRRGEAGRAPDAVVNVPSGAVSTPTKH